MSREAELRLLKEKEARKHKLEEHEKQEIDYARKKSIFASEPKLGQPVIEFITNYTMVRSMFKLSPNNGLILIFSFHFF